VTIIEDSMKATINQLETDYRAMEVLYKTTIQMMVEQADRIEALQTIARLEAGQRKVATE